MKSLWALLISFLLIGCSGTLRQPVKLDSDDEKAAYAVGYQTAQFMKKNVTEQGLDAYLDQFILGLHTTLDKNDEKLHLTDSEIEHYIAYQTEKSQSRAEEKRRLTAQKNLTEGRELQTANAQRASVVVLDNGLQYEVLSSGKNSSTPAATDSVTVHYHGTLPDGSVFDSSINRGEPVAFPIPHVITGWQIALQMMSEGERWKIIVPPELAYGEQGSGNLIGPNQTLIFELHLIKIES